MTIDETLISIIDQRIRQHNVTERATGTCVDRDSTGPGALVIFDGATVAVPVKVTGSTGVRPGYRCVLEKFGTEWLVVGSFANPVLGIASQFVFNGAQTTTSTTFVDMTNIPPQSFTKLHDGTGVGFNTNLSAVMLSAISGMRVGYRLTQVSGSAPFTAIDVQGPFGLLAQINGRHFFGNEAIYTFPMPAGVYSIQARMRMTTGSGTISLSTSDIWSMVVREYVDPSNPFV